MKLLVNAIFIITLSAIISAFLTVVIAAVSYFVSGNLDCDIWIPGTSKAFICKIVNLDQYPALGYIIPISIWIVSSVMLRKERIWK